MRPVDRFRLAIDRTLLLRIAAAILVIVFILLIGKVTILAFTRGGHDTSKVKRFEQEASGVAQKVPQPVEPAKTP